MTHQNTLWLAKLRTRADLAETSVEAAMTMLREKGETPLTLLAPQAMMTLARETAANHSLSVIIIPDALWTRANGWAVAGTRTTIWSKGA